MKKQLSIRSTVYPDQKLSFDEFKIHIKKELSLLIPEIPEHRKPSRFHLNKFKS